MSVKLLFSQKNCIIFFFSFQLITNALIVSFYTGRVSIKVFLFLAGGCGNPPVVRNAWVRKGGRDLGDIRQYQCVDYAQSKHNGNTIRCQSDGLWTALKLPLCSSDEG